jgi:hypothetical protein
MSEYAGKIAVGAIVAVAVAVGLGFELSNYIPNNSSSTSANVSLTSSSASFTCTGGSYRGTTWMLTYNLTDGRISGPGSPCGRTDVPKGMGAMDVTTNPDLPIMLANGWSNAFYVNLTSRQITQIRGVTFSPDYMQAFYDGQRIINGTMLPTPYFSLVTTVSNRLCTYLDGTTHVQLTPLKSGPIYLSVVTAQGLPVNNGTIYVSNRVNATYWQGSNNYCMLLSANPNGRGFMQVTENDTRLGHGVYNFTIVAEYGANQAFKVAIHDIAVQPNDTTYVTISIPSGEVKTVTISCNQANSCTQSTSTSSSKGG